MSSDPPPPVRLMIASTPEHLCVVRAAMERYCGGLGFDELARGDIVLAVDEALSNIIRHAYHGQGDQPIEVTACPMHDAGNGRSGIQIELRDWGQSVEPSQLRSRDLSEVRPGGLGVHIMQACMDSVCYTPLPEGGSRLVMVKKLPVRSKT